MRKKRQKEKQQKKEEVKQKEIQQRQQEKAVQKTIDEIIAALGESDIKPTVQIERIVKRLGIAFAMEKLKEAEAVEADGGLTLANDSKRRRTKGGVFFYLVKQQLRQDERQEDIREIFNRKTGAGDARKAAEAEEAQPDADAPANEAHAEPVSS
jgi:hypothetical protein